MREGRLCIFCVVCLAFDVVCAMFLLHFYTLFVIYV